ncbi:MULTISPECIES: OPT family oligopeptide transporter [Treponema]|jgi:putative OPT family oligopeptide transporter|uniref:Oligopeptide transporter, OPT family n=2 Tax=Treponema saccharophilum TaxID=165 RepID=H7EMX0_9SPIR|nr:MULTISPECIES: oligopeptide transporter, OPT family [Treponema]EIC01034.1 oligopeptide transporter, OPT family [Treponema saccharophilum DSM 2985]MBQ5536607.1 oligopeptide transporter, OPT family [Treponema sp.]BDC95346.1 oligopeptide transporter, OPT family protein [Treponema saccharophilum]
MEKTQFTPYIPADRITPEFTATSVITGIILAIVFGAANAYLGLRVGMTISASIPAAVIAMGVTRIILKKNSILESNMVQTIGSAGESVAAGAIFTIPALFLWAKEGLIGEPSLLTISLITVCGAVLGVLFMIPLRNSIIVQEHGTLPYPEAQACTEVLLSGEKDNSGAKAIFAGMGFSAVVKFVIDGLKLVQGAISVPIGFLKTEFATEIYPAVIGVGYICGIKISSYLFAGGILAWFVLIPAIITFGGSSTIFPATASIKELYENGGAGAIWSSYIRYIGAGALAAAGIISLIKSLPLIVRTFTSALGGLSKSAANGADRTEKDIDIKFVLAGCAVIAVAIWLLPPIQAGIISAILIVIFGFFFATVSSKMVGLVGSSNNPVSGMAIATILISTILLKVSGDTGSHGMVSAITIGSIICVVAALAGDMSQDLKTGFLLGATPRKQQIGELIGAVVSALSIGGVLILLDKAWGFGSSELSAPQATLMKLVTEGVMDGNLPWAFVFLGVFITIAAEIVRIPSLAVAIGIYLPLELTAPIMIGGVIRHAIESRNKDSAKENSSGVLFSSGLIAGEGIIGIILALITVLGLDGAIDLSSANTGTVGGVVVLALIVAAITKFALVKARK